MKEAFCSISSGTAVVPHRINMPLEEFGAHHLSMPAYIKGGKFLTIKLINVHPGNPLNDLALINGVILVMEAESGKSVALIDGSSVTAIRTGAASGLATHYLSKPNSKKAVVIGNGAQAKTQIEAIQSVRNLEEVFWSSEETLTKYNLFASNLKLRLLLVKSMTSKKQISHVLQPAHRSLYLILQTSRMEPI